MPDFESGFPDHEHHNPWYTVAHYEWDLFTFEYAGQWWSGFGAIDKIMLFITPILMYVAIEYTATERQKYHLISWTDNWPIGDVTAKGLPNIVLV